MAPRHTDVQFALCIENRDCEDIEKRKAYRILPDKAAANDGYVRVVDESGEDYLYPASYFVQIDVPAEAHDALSAAR